MREKDKAVRRELGKTFRLKRMTDTQIYSLRGKGGKTKILLRC